MGLPGRALFLLDRRLSFWMICPTGDVRISRNEIYALHKSNTKYISPLHDPMYSTAYRP